MNVRLFTEVMENMPHGTFQARHLRAAAEVLRVNNATARQINTLANVFEKVNKNFRRDLFIRKSTR